MSLLWQHMGKKTTKDPYINMLVLLWNSIFSCSTAIHTYTHTQTCIASFKIAKSFFTHRLLEQSICRTFNYCTILFDLRIPLNCVKRFTTAYSCKKRSTKLFRPERKDKNQQKQGCQGSLEAKSQTKFNRSCSGKYPTEIFRITSKYLSAS